MQAWKTNKQEKNKKKKNGITEVQRKAAYQCRAPLTTVFAEAFCLVAQRWLSTSDVKVLGSQTAPGVSSFPETPSARIWDKQASLSWRHVRENSQTDPAQE